MAAILDVVIAFFAARLPAGDVRTLCGNMSDLIAFQKTFLHDLQSLDRYYTVVMCLASW